MRQTSTVRRLREQLFERVAPKVDYGENIQDPIVPGLQVAKWLPVAFKTQGDRTRGESAFVIAKGKPVAMARDAEGGLVPAGLAADLIANGLVYTADDVAWYTEDLVTGEAVASPAPTYTRDQVAQAIWDRGLVDAAMATEAAAKHSVALYDPANLPGAGGAAPDEEFDAIIHALISSPVGHAKDHLWCYLGSAEEGDFKFQNYAPKHKVSIRTRGVLRVPHVVASNGSQAVDGSGAAATYVTDGQPVVGSWYNATNAVSFARYAQMGLTAASPVVLAVLTANTLAKNTSRTPISTNNAAHTAALLIREVDSAAKISKAGDFFVDEEGGALLLFATSWTGLAAAVTFTFSHYADYTASTAAEVSFCGEARPGDRVTFDAASNLIVADSTVAASEIVGQVLTVLKGPRGGLERVRTGWHDANVSAKSKMPGSATDGYSDLITMAEETAADETVIIKFCV